MGFPDDFAADLHRDMRAFSEGDLRTDSCGDWESDFPADWYRDSDADLRRDSQEDFRCGFDGDLRDTGQLLVSRFVCRRDPSSASGRQREKGSRVQGFKGSRVRAQGEAPPRGCATHRRNERGDAPGRLRHLRGLAPSRSDVYIIIDRSRPLAGRLAVWLAGRLPPRFAH
jgi:hypothetical protein